MTIYTQETQTHNLPKVQTQTTQQETDEYACGSVADRTNEHLSNLHKTLGDKDWLLKHTDDLRKLLPETWTHAHNVNLLKLGFDLKLLGVDWRSQYQLTSCMVFFEKVGLLKRDGLLIRRSN